MEKNFSKKSFIIVSVVIVVIVIIGVVITLVKNGNILERNKDIEFQNESGIYFTEITELQIENLYRLSKIWGFAKYRHPSITDGTINWDAELFRVMPKVFDATNNEEANEIILHWMNQFTFEVPIEGVEEVVTSIESIGEIILEADLLWIKDTDELGEELSNYLVKLSEVIVMDSTNGYVSFLNTGSSNMEGEEEYLRIKYNDTGMRLLGLFRYWNIIEYFFPYKDIMEEDWNQILKEMIPEFIKGNDYQSYMLTIGHLSTHIHDSHASVIDLSKQQFYNYGMKRPTVEFENIDGQIIISKKESSNENENENLKLGDVVLSMDGISIEERIKNCRNYISISNEERFTLSFRYHLLATDNDVAVMEVLRDNKKISLNIKCYTKNLSSLSGQEKSEMIENEQIGYINPARLKSGEIDTLMKEYKDTSGLVIDLRNYPSDFVGMSYTMAEYLIPNATPFIKFGVCNPLVPGSFIGLPPNVSGRVSDYDLKGKDLYTEKVIILMDETSISRTEFTIMALRNAKNVVVLGSPSIGADGEVVQFALPGGVTVSMTGMSVFYPDGEQTQRVGLLPDIYVTPTIVGLKEGRDELLEKAVSIILE